MKEAISSFPKTLDETYERIINGIVGLGYGQDALTLLQWLVFSAQPLNIEEAVEILAVDHSKRIVDPDKRLIDPYTILSICSSLISIVHLPSQGSKMKFKQTKRDTGKELNHVCYIF